MIYKEIRTYGTIHSASVWTNTSYPAKTLQVPFQIEPSFLQHTPLHIHPDLTWVGWLAGWSTLLYGVLLRTCTCIYSTYQSIDFIPLHVFSFHSYFPPYFHFRVPSIRLCFFFFFSPRLETSKQAWVTRIGWDLSVDLQPVQTSDVLVLAA